MAFGISTKGVPRLYNYAAASRHEHDVTPIRGKDIKPLGKRTAQHMQILRYGAGTADERVACRLYSTDCVVFYENGTIKLDHGGHVTQSTATFMSAVLGPYVYQHDGHLMYVREGKTYVIPMRGLTIAPNGDVQDPPQVTIHTLNRKAVKEVRAKYQRLKDMAVAMCRLQDGVPASNEYPLDLYLPETEDDYGEFIQRLMSSCATAYPHTGLGTPIRVLRCSDVTLVNKLDNMILKQYRDVVFERTVLPPGVYKKDKYAKFFE